MKNKAKIKALLMILLLTFSANILKASNQQALNSDAAEKGSIPKIKMITLAFGGTGVLFTQVNNQLGVMTGGRGSATFNNRYTFGGAGWGMPKGVEIESTKTNTLEFFKFGYGGLEFGYIFHEGQKVRFGSNLLAGCGVGFQEKYPKSKGEVKLFPVFEPTLYAQISLGNLLKLDIGLTYRFVTGSNFSFLNNWQLSGPSIYIALLVGTCNCN